MSSDFFSAQELIDALSEGASINKYRAQSIAEVLIATMDMYREKHAKGISPIIKERVTNKGTVKYQLNVAFNSYIKWVEQGFKKIVEHTNDGELFLINGSGLRTNELSIILGLLESMSVLSFKMLGGANSQLFIYVNQIQMLKNILNNPFIYKNRLLDMIHERHMISVQMLKYLYESDMDSASIWNLLEDYFLGNIPKIVEKKYLEEKEKF